MRSNIWSRPSSCKHTHVGPPFVSAIVSYTTVAGAGCIQRIIERQLQNLTKADDSRNQDGIHADYTDEIKEGNADTAGENTGQQSPDPDYE